MFGSMMTIGLMLKAYDHMSAVVATASGKSIVSLSKIQEKMKALSDQADAFGKRALADGMVLTGAVGKPLAAFADLEQATTDLKVAMMNNLGEVPKQFEEISRQANALGNVLPGNTADFIASARALKEQGVGMDTVVNGGLKSASYLSVLLKMPAADAAEMVAKLREAYGLADNELEKMADLTQRARFAFGMTPQDIKLASSYSGATQNTLGLTGLDNAKKLLAMQGMGAGVGLEGSSWGTNFAAMLTRTAESKDRLARNSKEMKAINAEMKAYGINLEFFNDKGAFMGLDNLVQQLEKTKVMTQVDQLNLFKKLFGAEAARPASIIASKGMAGYQEAIANMERQASLQQRIELSLSTMKNQWEALAGTATNALAMIGGPIAHFIAPYIVALNNFVGGPLAEFITQHKTLVAVVGTAILVMGLLAMSLGVLGLVVGSVGKYIGAGITAIQGMATASRVAMTWLAAHRLEILRLTGAQRAQIAVQNVQNAIASRGGVWQALQAAMMTTRLRALEMTTATKTWITTVAGLRGLAASFGGALLRNMRAAVVAVQAFSFTGFLVGTHLVSAATKAVWGFSAALMANPMTWVVAAIAAGAFLVWKYWKPISSFFSGLWEGIKTGLGPLAPAFEAFAKLASAALSPVLGPLKAVWDWLKKIFTQVEDTGGGARKMGVAVGEGIGQAIAWVARLGKAIIELPGKFFDAGVDLVKGLIRGIESMASKPVEAIKKMGAATAGAFKDLLGIRSPSRVFMGFGTNIGEGVEVGLTRTRAQVRQAAGALALGAVAGFGQPVLAAPAMAPLLQVSAPAVPSMSVMPIPARSVVKPEAGVAPLKAALPLTTPAPRLPTMAPLPPVSLQVLPSMNRIPVPTPPVAVPPIRIPQLQASVPAVAAVGPVRLPQPAAQPGSQDRGNITVHFSPVIHVSGGTETGSQVKAALDDGYREFEARMRRFLAEQQRRAF